MGWAIAGALDWVIAGHGLWLGALAGYGLWELFKGPLCLP